MYCSGVCHRLYILCYVIIIMSQVGEIISMFEKKGFTLKGLKLITVDHSFAEKHYADLSAKPFFRGLVEYIVSGPVCAMVWEGKNVVTTGRKIIGATNPAESAPGTIRGDFAIDIGRGRPRPMMMTISTLATLVMRVLNLMMTVI